MRLNLGTDYAIRILIYLAADEAKLHAVSEVSRAYGIPNSTVMKIVSDLVRLGFVQSLRGRSGGIRLSRPAAEINLGAVVRAVEGSMTLADCESCVIAPRCRLKGIFREAVEAFIGVLARHSLADVASNAQELEPFFRLMGEVRPADCGVHDAP